MDLSAAIEAKESSFLGTNQDFNNPPLNFEIEKPSINGNKYVCRLCSGLRKKFICKKCLQQGLFFSSNQNNATNNSEERYLDKQQKLKNLLNAQAILNTKFSSKFETFTKLEDLRTSILKYRNKNEILRQLIVDKKASIQKLCDQKKENHDRNRATRIILPRYEDKVNKLGEYVMEAIEKNEDSRKKSKEKMEELKALRRSHIEKLKFIFPIHACPNQSVSSSSSSSSLSSDARQIIEEYIIADGPALPATGEYFELYSRWLAYNKDLSSNNNEATHVESKNAAYRIIAGLTYLQHLVQALSFFLDIRLPNKISNNDFSRMALNELEFRKKVLRLNLNVAYLSYMQNVPTRFIQPARTVENVLQLLDVSNDKLGFTGAIQDTSDTKSIDSIILSFTDLIDNGESESGDYDSDLEDESHKEEWENVSPNISPSSDVVTHSMVPESSGTMTNTLRNVAHSLWRGWK